MDEIAAGQTGGVELIVDELAAATRQAMYHPHPRHLLSFEQGDTMREHLETLMTALADAMRRDHGAVRTDFVEPRHRRPRRARATYVPVRYDLATGRFAH